MAPLLRRGIVSPSNSELLQNTIGFVVPSLILFVLRIVNAVWVLGKMNLEDWLMCIAMCFYLSLLVLINVSARYMTNLFPPEQLEAIMADPEDVASRRLGSIIVIPLEQCMLASTWCVKKALRFLMFYIIVGYVTIMLVYYVGVCRPFNQYWAVPVKNEQCATYSHYSVVQMVFNISSDIGLIIIPLCMFSMARLPLRRKAILMVVFSLAVFTILAAIMNKAAPSFSTDTSSRIYNFESPLTTVYQVWYIRESSVAIWVGNLICCWQIIQKVFKTRSFDNRTPNIVMQPEMGARLANPSNFTSGGTPKPKNWFEQIVHLRAAAGNFLSIATRTKNTGHMQSSSDQYPMNSLDKGLDSNCQPISLMTLEKGDEDIGPALQYRDSQHIA
ncbi:integral membrane PTH11 protein [Rutstroemia sp. NJR-2017a BBW]|nr:integral membrane PTH11 protein [Rutstroemia sp. NJR-2017a BBW]